MATRKKKKMTREEKFIQRVYKLRLRNPAKHTPGTAASATENQNPDHLSGQTRVRGNLASGSHIYVFEEGKLKAAHVQSYYAWNAWNFIGSGAEAMRNIYKSGPHPEYHFFHTDHRPNFFQLYPVAALGTHSDAEARYHQARDPALRRYYRRKKGVLYPVEKLQKMKTFIGAKLPYPWQAHHLLPTNVFYKNLTLEQIKIILATEYDINDGRNIIFLPEELVDTVVHKLPVHASQHTKYDDKVKNEMKQLKSTLDDVVKNKRKHEEAAAAVEKILHSMERKMFVYTQSLGSKPRQRMN